MTRTVALLLIWIIATLAGGTVFAAAMVYGGGVRSSLLIGRTTDGHHQIELACNACHVSPFAGKEAMQKACVGCHGAALAEEKDSHPRKKFTDPRNADRLEKLAATECITCHTEHRPRITHALGVTLPTDYCQLCHDDVAKERPSHKDLAFSTCRDSGCHNYHDNRALYEDFLEKHADEPALLKRLVVKLRASPPERASDATPITDPAVADAPAEVVADATIRQDWLATAHAKGGVNCSGCHAPGAKTPDAIKAAWIERPDQQSCKACHQQEVKTFTEGKHGMRLAPDLLTSTAGPLGLFHRTALGPMRPDMARVPMRADARGVDLTCNTCHPAHAFDTRKAEVQACLGCHDDRHSLNYAGSPHDKLWQAELAGTAPKGSGVTCATCHLPRTSFEDPDTYEERLVVVHNQNANLRPNEKMLRSVCMDCHGLGFSMDALADTALITRNFAGRPSVRVESIEWVKRRLKDREGRSAEPANAK